MSSARTPYYLDVVEPRVGAGERLTASFATRLNLGPGSYSVTVRRTQRPRPYEHNFDWWDRALCSRSCPATPSAFKGRRCCPSKRAWKSRRANTRARTGFPPP
jgi:hypothetical protein